MALPDPHGRSKSSTKMKNAVDGSRRRTHGELFRSPRNFLLYDMRHVRCVGNQNFSRASLLSRLTFERIIYLLSSRQRVKHLCDRWFTVDLLIARKWGPYSCWANKGGMFCKMRKNPGTSGYCSTQDHPCWLSHCGLISRTLSMEIKITIYVKTRSF